MRRNKRVLRILLVIYWITFALVVTLFMSTEVFVPLIKGYGLVQTIAGIPYICAAILLMYGFGIMLEIFYSYYCERSS